MGFAVHAGTCRDISYNVSLTSFSRFIIYNFLLRVGFVLCIFLSSLLPSSNSRVRVVWLFINSPFIGRSTNSTDNANSNNSIELIK